jgi:diaminopimelate epimerase
MQLRFTKMHGLGNDFVVIDLVTQRFRLQPEHVRQIADRHFGIGCDQVLVLEAPQTPDADFRYRIFNADGGEVEQCGNGARCFAMFVKDKKLSGKNHLVVETAQGLIELRIERDSRVRVDMGPARFEPAQIPFTADARAESYAIEVDGKSYDIGTVSMGNPHAVLRVDDVDSAPVTTLGPLIERHARFPNRVNAGFMQIVDKKTIRLRVFERGVGETLACGTGACAAVVYGRARGWLDRHVTVKLPGGELLIDWESEKHNVIMIGPATKVFEGRIYLQGS